MKVADPVLSCVNGCSGADSPVSQDVEEWGKQEEGVPEHCCHEHASFWFTTGLRLPARPLCKETDPCSPLGHASGLEC